MYKKYLIFICLLFILFSSNTHALEISNYNILINNEITKKLTDDNYNSKEYIKKSTTVNIKSDSIINHVYIIYELKSTTGTLTIGNQDLKIGTNGYLHEYIDIAKYKNNQLNITYDSDVTISEIYIFNEEKLPSWVQKWEELDQADLMIISTHSDDEHLFFAGIIPTYLNKNLKIKVVYLTNHNSTPPRLHEQLNGLWAVGLTYYPTIGPFPDAYSTSLDNALKNLTNSGYTIDDVIKFQVENIRKYKPLVIVGHDENGEYGHGQHILNTYALKFALEKTNDKTYNNNYEIYDVPKVYLHLYKDKQLVMDYDIPLIKYNNLTAYEVSKLGYACHKSQQYTWFTDWLSGKNNSYTKATEITKYSPMQFGLYKSLVGEDIIKNDMFENITLRENDITTSFKIYNFYKKSNFTIIFAFCGIISTLFIALILVILIIRRLK